MSLPIGSVPTSAIQDTSNVIFADGDAPRKYAYGEVKKDLLGTESLNTTAQTIKGAINENVASLSKRAIYITPEMFGCVGDGVADDTVNLQAAIDYAITNNISLRSYKNKKFKITAPLNLIMSGSNGICMDFGNATILAGSIMESLIYFNVTGDLVVNNIINNLCLECEELANGIKFDYANSPLFHNLYIRNPNSYGVRVITGAIKMSHSYILKDTFNNVETTGILIESGSSDSKFDMIFMRDIKYAVVDNGSSNFYHKIHPWLMTKEILAGSIAFRLFRGGYLNECMFDTYETCLEVNSNSAITLNGCVLYINTMFYNDTTNPTQPTIFKYTNAMVDLNSLVIEGCNFNFLSYYNTTGKNGLFSNAPATQVIGQNYVALTSNNRFKYIDGLPTLAGETNGSLILGSSYTSITNSISNKNGFINIKLVLDKTSSDFSTTSVENLGNFPEGFYPDDLIGYGFYKGYIRNNDVTDPLQFTEVDVLALVNNGVRYLAIKIPSGTDVTNKRHLVINLTLKSYTVE